jgi:predicted metal-dependent hydrolase
VEEVVVHELCHLVERNHSRRFWREVEQRFGDWHGERDYLRAEGPALKLRLQRLLTPVA